MLYYIIEVFVSCAPSTQDPSVYELRSFPFLPQHVVDCSNLFLQTP